MYKIKLVTPTVRIMYPHLFDKDQYGKYSATLIFANEDATQTVADAIVECYTDEYGENKRAEALAIVDDKLKPSSTVKGGYELKVKSNYPVGVVKYKAMSTPVPVTDPEEVYSGSYGMASLGINHSMYQKTKHVSIYLENYMKTKDGTPLSKSSNPQDAFGAITPDDFGDESEEL